MNDYSPKIPRKNISAEEIFSPLCAEVDGSVLEKVLPIRRYVADLEAKVREYEGLTECVQSQSDSLFDRLDFAEQFCNKICDLASKGKDRDLKSLAQEWFNRKR